MACEIDADGAPVGASVEEVAAAAPLGLSGAAMVPVQTELSGQQATLPTWSSAQAAFLGQQTGGPMLE